MHSYMTLCRFHSHEEHCIVEATINILTYKKENKKVKSLQFILWTRVLTLLILTCSREILSFRLLLSCGCLTINFDFFYVQQKTFGRRSFLRRREKQLH